jgi:hypothetical protein
MPGRLVDLEIHMNQPKGPTMPTLTNPTSTSNEEILPIETPEGEDPLHPGEESMANDPEPEVGNCGNPPR